MSGQTFLRGLFQESVQDQPVHTDKRSWAHEHLVGAATADDEVNRLQYDSSANIYASQISW